MLAEDLQEQILDSQQNPTENLTKQQLLIYLIANLKKKKLLCFHKPDEVSIFLEFLLYN